MLQFDFRGHGASDPAGTTLGTAERRDVAAAVRLLQGRGLGPIALYGISMGGATAVLAAPDLPVAAVVADAAYADMRHPIENRMREQRLPLPGLGSRLIVAGAALRTRTRLISPIDRVADVAPRGLLLIAPREDRLVSWRQSVRLYEAAGEPKELYVVDGAAHGEARMVGRGGLRATGPRLPRPLPRTGAGSQRRQEASRQPTIIRPTRAGRTCRTGRALARAHGRQGPGR